MNQPSSSFKPKILVAPLDWGLGHATRCIPIIHSLLRHNCAPLLGGDGSIKVLLQQEFPHLPFIDLPGYHIHYARNKWNLPLALAIQIPKILSRIQYENKRLRCLVKEHNIHGIISDNRYGLYHREVPSIFITHQLLIKTSWGKHMDHLLQQLNYHYINRFTQCWIPDHQHGQNLAGELSHPNLMPGIPSTYLGALSRFTHSVPMEEKHLLVLLSGPEPQRTIFEQLCMEQLHQYKEPVVVVRGLPDAKNTIEAGTNVQVYNHLPAIELEIKMRTANFVISRCGYSTVMDLAALKKKSILVPTPAQTEQEYLARHLSANHVAFCMDQQKFNLQEALQRARHFPYQFISIERDQHLDNAIKRFALIVYATRHDDREE